VNTIDIEEGVRAKGRGGFLGDVAGFGHGVARSELDGEPLIETISITENPAHLRAGIAGDHFSFTRILWRTLQRAAAAFAPLIGKCRDESRHGTGVNPLGETIWGCDTCRCMIL